MILELQAPIRGIRQKHTKDATQMHRISNPTSHLQRGPTRPSKSTYKGPAPTYTNKDPPVSHLDKDGGQRRPSGVGRTTGSAEPGLAPVVRIDGPRGGVNWAFFKFPKQIKATLTYAMLVRLNSPTG